jgi:hypothetical protein
MSQPSQPSQLQLPFWAFAVLWVFAIATLGFYLFFIKQLAPIYFVWFMLLSLVPFALRAISLEEKRINKEFHNLED